MRFVKTSFVIAASTLVLAIVTLVGIAATRPSGGSAAHEVSLNALARPQTVSDALPLPARAAAQAHGYATESSRLIAPGTYLIERSPGLLCVVSASLSGGCNQAGAFFRGEPIVFEVLQTGGGTSPVTDLRIFGAARPDVASVQLTVGSSVAASAMPTSDGGFVMRANPQELPSGADQVVSAMRRNGSVIASYTLPRG
jgi:hypothetical protein